MILYEVTENVKDIEVEIKKILELAEKIGDNKKLELLIDGGAFAKMLLAKLEVLQ